MTMIDSAKHRRDQRGVLRDKLWFRNVIATVAVVVLFVIIATISFWGPWREYQASIRPEYLVPAGQSAAVHDQTWELGEIRRLGKRQGALNTVLPKGTQLIMVTIKRSGPPPADMYCAARITDGTHMWKAEFDNGGVRIPDGSTQSCGRPGDLLFVFLMPDDIEPQAVEITENIGGKILVRLDLP